MRNIAHPHVRLLVFVIVSGQAIIVQARNGIRLTRSRQLGQKTLIFKIQVDHLGARVDGTLGTARRPAFIVTLRQWNPQMSQVIVTLHSLDAVSWNNLKVLKDMIQDVLEREARHGDEGRTKQRRLWFI